jgi:micrococcal nuclease
MSDEREYVQRVVDGDTLMLGSGERVRLIGVDTPEFERPNSPVEYFAKEAAAFTKRLAEGKLVKLEFDPANAHIEHKDRFGRTLAYVFLEDGTLINAEIIRQGYGHAFTRYPFSRMEEFRRLEREARDQGRGLWSKQRGVIYRQVLKSLPVSFAAKSREFFRSGLFVRQLYPSVVSKNQQQ